MNTVASWRQKSKSELNTLLQEKLRQQFKLRMQHATGELKSTHELKQVRRNIAQLTMLLNEAGKSEGVN